MDKTLAFFKQEIAIRISLKIQLIVHICSYFKFQLFYFVQIHLELYITHQFSHLKTMFLLN